MLKRQLNNKSCACVRLTVGATTVSVPVRGVDNKWVEQAVPAPLRRELKRALRASGLLKTKPKGDGDGASVGH